MAGHDKGGSGVSLSERLRCLDAHTTVSSEFRVRTSSGALFSVLTLISTAYLLQSEYKFNFSTSILDHVHVNATTPAGLEVEFDITFPSVPCALLSVDANDPTGQPQSLHLDRTHHVWKHRIDKRGRLIGRKSRFELGGTLQSEQHVKEIAEQKGMKVYTDDAEKDKLEAEHRARLEVDEKYKAEAEEKERQRAMDLDGEGGMKLEREEEECGDCYGAGEEGECCPTCDDVKRAYQRKGWHIDIKNVKQCQHQLKSADEKDEGCNIHGKVALSTGGGNLHIAPGRSLEHFGEEQSRDMFTSLVDFITESFESFNVSHTVNRLRFGQEFPGASHQLDNQDRIIEDAYGMYQYYVQVVPTLFRYLNGTTVQTNQYSVTEHMRHVTPGSGRGLPGVFFFYEVSALHVELEEYRRGWVHFLTSVCAIVGGVFTVMGMADKMVYSRTSLEGGAAGAYGLGSSRSVLG